MKKRFDAYQYVTDVILEALEKGVVPWRKPWIAEAPYNLSTGKDYRGINRVLLGMSGFACPAWLTYKQAVALGGDVSGQNSTPVIFCGLRIKNEGEENEERFYIYRRYNVFNVEQCKGIEIPDSPILSQNSKIDMAESIAGNYLDGPIINVGGSMAFYRPRTDQVQMPSMNSFVNSEEYYSTLFHELTHSTGHSKRLDRALDKRTNHFGSEAYSKEELVAEFGAAFLCQVSGIDNTINNSAAYINSWMNKLSAEPGLALKAAGLAQKGTDHILGVSFDEN